MKKQNFFWAKNLKFLRERKQLTQDQLSAKLEISRANLQAYESGATKNPPFDVQVRVSDYFKISIDSMVRIDLGKLGELKLRDLEAGNDVFITGGKIRVLAITVDPKNKENIEYIPVKAKAGYNSGYNDPEYIATLPKYSLPNLSKDGTFRIFPIVGDSMLPVPENSDIIARYVENWKSLKPATACILILNAVNDFVFKLVTIMDDGNVLLESLNKTYQPYTVHISDVLEIWQFHSYQTSQLPQPQIELQSMAKTINEILSEVRALKSNKK